LQGGILTKNELVFQHNLNPAGYIDISLITYYLALAALSSNPVKYTNFVDLTLVKYTGTY